MVISEIFKANSLGANTSSAGLHNPLITKNLGGQAP